MTAAATSIDADENIIARECGYLSRLWAATTGSLPRLTILNVMDVGNDTTRLRLDKPVNVGLGEPATTDMPQNGEVLLRPYEDWDPVMQHNL